MVKDRKKASSSGHPSSSAWGLWMAMVAAVAVLAWGAWWVGQPQPVVQTPPPVQTMPIANLAQEAPSGSPQSMAPDFSAPDVATGKVITLSGLKGKVVLVDFWATWCGPCRMAIPHLIELQKEFGTKGVQIVGVSLDQKGPAVVKPFMKSWKMNYPTIMDADGQLASQWGGIRGIPSLFLVDKKGKIVQNFVGYQPKEALLGPIKRLLNES